MSRAEPTRASAASNAVAAAGGVDRIYDAAVQLFAQYGYHGTTTRQIATEAGLSPAAIYSHFPSKYELLRRITEDAHARILHAMESALEESESTGDAPLYALAYAHAYFHATNLAATRVANYDLSVLQAEDYAEIRKVRKRLEDLTTEAVFSASSKGEADEGGHRVAAIAVLSMGVDISRWYHPYGALTPHDVAIWYATFAVSLAGNIHLSDAALPSVQGLAGP